MSILINDGNLHEENMTKCDIGEFVSSIEKLKKFIEPTKKLYNYITSVLRWEQPFHSVIWMMSLSMLAVTNPVYIWISLILPIPPILCAEFVRASGKRKSSTKRYIDYFERTDEIYHQMQRHAKYEKWKEDLYKYLEILMAMQRMFSEWIEYFEMFHRVLTWKEPKLSSFVLLLSLCLEFSLYLFDPGRVLFVIIISCFLINKHLFRGIIDGLLQMKKSLLQLFKPSNKSFTPDVDEKLKPFLNENIYLKEKKMTDTETVLGEVDGSSSTDTDEGDPDVTDTDVIDSKKEAVESTRATGFAMSKFLPNSLRRRYMQSGNCFSCDNPASSILKKRRYCRHCGHGFCSRCCNLRVPRAFLGATAPAAYAEKVLVCNSCYTFLHNRQKTTPTELVE